MNLPNRLTVLRILLVPVLVLFLLCEQISFSTIWALVIFVAASITDYLDGKIARRRNMITNFGKFLDPMADKILVISAMICFSYMDLCSPVVLIIVIAREFMVSSLRLVAASQGIVLAAGWSGKLKTASQMVSIVTTRPLLRKPAVTDWKTMYQREHSQTECWQTGRAGPFDAQLPSPLFLLISCVCRRLYEGRFFHQDPPSGYCPWQKGVPVQTE